MNALTLLKDDHDKLKKLLKEGEKKDAPQERRSMLNEIAHEFRVHEKIEEEIFYPALKEHPRARDIVLEGYQEHHVVDVLLRELEGMPPSDERWAAKLKVLTENVEHHIEEEEDEMFSKAKKVFDDNELDSLGNQMEEMKSAAMRA
jgi:hemerythrin-like domain-containing protein